MPGSSQQLPGLVRKDPAVQPQVRPSGSQGFLRGTDDHFQRKAPDPQGLLHTSSEEARSATEVHWPEWAGGGRMRMGLTPSLAHRGPVGTRGPERVAGTSTLSALWSLPTCARGRSGGHTAERPRGSPWSPTPCCGRWPRGATSPEGVLQVRDPRGSIARLPACEQLDCVPPSSQARALIPAPQNVQNVERGPLMSY